ncbi:MAG: protein kinase domain-containing protein, partial [Planctomycetota bacterium]
MMKANDNDRQSKLDATVLRFIEAQTRGDAPDVEEFVKQYPGLEQEIRQKVASLDQVDSLFDSLRHADASDFPMAPTGKELVGEKVGAFNVLEVIGRGGMGVVYKGQDSRLDRIVAIKAMPAHLLENRTAQARFRREARVLASLSHPNIAIIYDVIERDKGLTYLILEYVAGETLAERLARGPLGLKEALPLCRQIVEAVSAAHDKGVIHRDLKPTNIKITPEGRVKVLDFGLAKATHEAASRDMTVTQVGQLIGTPAYMSPEQIRGTPIDRRTDIWSFGCVLYQMLTGEAPFEGKTVSDTVAHVLEREPDWQRLPPEIPPGVRELLRRCLEKDPQRRLQDMSDVNAVIEGTLDGATVMLPPPAAASARPAIAARPRLLRTAMLAGAVVLVALSGLAVWTTLIRLTSPPSRDIWLVILPFENPGPDEDEYFADSTTDRITSHLAPVPGLSVLSPRTAAQYPRGTKTAQQIGKELRVDYILEGTVQRERPSDLTSPMRINSQLIKASEDRLVLAPIYPIVSEDLNELFRVQSDLAEQVAQALDVTLLEPQRRAFQSRPTRNREAYEYYLGGNDYFHRSHEEGDFRIAIDMYEKAVDQDPTFALAFSRLSMAHSWMYWFYDRNEERLMRAREAVDKAFELSPDLPEAHAALGRYYYSLLDFDRALDHFAIARKSLRDDSEVLSNIGYCQRRQGKFEQALANIKRARELDHLSNKMNLQLAVTFMLLRRYPDAERYYERGIELRPDAAFGYSWKAGLYLQWQGSTQKARAVLERASQNVDTSKDEWIVLRSVMLDVFDERYPEALDRLSAYESEAFETQFYFIPKT